MIDIYLNETLLCINLELLLHKLCCYSFCFCYHLILFVYYCPIINRKQVFFSIIAGSSFYSSFLLIIYTKMNTVFSNSGDCFIFIITGNIHHYDFRVVYSYHLFLLSKWLNGVVLHLLHNVFIHTSIFNIHTNPHIPLRSEYLLLLFCYFL